ncbi:MULTISPECIES: cytochrome-c peroxidase [Sphingomonas]|uniref:Cytochrome c peroxidase n=1 Tax=Sphingomonas trueperi TaxID=53317 RepID=A0A7X6BAV4_9SPHN|nr:cytochrome c peroxidase [Sphingomonas sp. ABOLD]NJB95808.1 cytochrome c peroxidase [Sphingomonas trueperi]
MRRGLLVRTCAGLAGAATLGIGAALAAQWVVQDEPITPLPPAPAIAPAKLALGALLFRDPRLSQRQTVSCNSCHDLGTNGASNRNFDVAQNGGALRMNTLTVFNAALNYRFNWRGRRETFERFTAQVLDDPALMGAANGVAVARLRRDPAMVARFRAVYGRHIDEAALVDALAAYQRSLVTPGARFDRWLAGDDRALSAQERRGYARFKALGCVSCHQGVNVGGNLMQRHGVFHPIGSADPVLVRVPSLRNVAATAPYFHDGSAPTLRHAVRAMGRAQLDLALSPQDVDDIVAFLGTLTGTYQGRPIRPPAPGSRR